MSQMVEIKVQCFICMEEETYINNCSGYGCKGYHPIGHNNNTRSNSNIVFTICCGHPIHLLCFQETTRNAVNGVCPMCRKTLDERLQMCGQLKTQNVHGRLQYWQ